MFSGLSKELNNWLPNIKKETEIILKEKENKEEIGGEGKEEIENVEDNKNLKEEENEKENDKIESKSSANANTPTSPSEDKSKLPSLELLGSVKSQVTSWLGSTLIPSMPTMPTMPTMPDIPGLKSDNSTPSEPPQTNEDGTPIENQNETQINVGVKAMEGAKNIGNFLYSAVNKAGQHVSEASIKIKQKVEETSILSEFNKNQQEFIEEINQKSQIQQIALPPWIGHPNEEILKQQCLNLSLDKKNFTRPPPPGIDFNFNYNNSYQIALVTLNEDENLKQMRFELVPKIIKEEIFWKNYFYRIHLILQSNELNSLEQENEMKSNINKETNINEISSHDEMNNIENNIDNATVDTITVSSLNKSNIHNNIDNDDFISDTFHIKEEHQDNNIEQNVEDEDEEWEKQLDEEIQEFELVQDYK